MALDVLDDHAVQLFASSRTRLPSACKMKRPAFQLVTSHLLLANFVMLRAQFLRLNIKQKHQTHSCKLPLMIHSLRVKTVKRRSQGQPEHAIPCLFADQGGCLHECLLQTSPFSFCRPIASHNYDEATACHMQSDHSS